MMVKTLESRFWAKVIKHDGACWEWIGSRTHFGSHGRIGYGRIRAGGTAPHIVAHRVSWELHNGPIPDGMNVLHHCDNPQCTNPEHLFLGTHADNMRDKEEKGRARPDGWLEKVTANNQSRRKITDETIAAIKAMQAAGMPKRQIARLLGIDRSIFRRL